MTMADRTDDFSRLELNLRNCLDNYRYFRSLLQPRTKLLVLVKANAYGHGAVEFASMMQRAGADYLAIALPVEGMELRISSPRSLTTGWSPASRTSIPSLRCATRCANAASGTSPSTSSWTPACTGWASFPANCPP